MKTEKQVEYILCATPNMWMPHVTVQHNSLRRGKVMDMENNFQENVTVCVCVL